jgi:hypothetical protein
MKISMITGKEKKKNRLGIKLIGRALAGMHKPWVLSPGLQERKNL